jgi:5-methyltetrahydrofolate--homocysteine methyltransferase
LVEDQRILFEILRPDEIGVQPTDGYMMDPEAIVFHHPEASYFAVDHGNAIASGI